MIGFGFGNAVGVDAGIFLRLSSSVARQLPASPMLVLARRIEHAFDVTVQCSHDANSRKHRWPVMFCNEEERRHRGLPCFGIVLYLGQFSDEERGVA
jgi:hypothetical protein